MTSEETMTGSLLTLNQDGSVPSSRVTSAPDVARLVLQWWDNDQKGRAQKRAKVTGLIQGNPPYSAAKQRAAGLAGVTNVNWRTAEAYEDAAAGALYDLFSGGPTFTVIRLDPTAEFKGNNPEKTKVWSDIVTEEFDYLQKNDRSWDSVAQNSIRETTRFGAGPQIFPDTVDWRTRWVPFGNLLLPEDASSDVNRWEVASILEDLYPHQLYQYIIDPESAKDAGWKVESVKQAIINANVDIQAPNFTRSWEWIQQQLKENSYTYSARCKVIQLIHFYAREFPLEGEAEGKITHCILLRSVVGTTSSNGFLFRRNRCYDTWQQCIHPMYYSQGQGGKHYGVTGQGIKMFGALETENRVLCNVVDQGMAPKTMFKPTTASGKQKALPQRMGNYLMMPEGYDLQQISVHSLVQDGVATREVISNLLSSNLSSYRQTLNPQKSGNPVTAEEIQFRASQQATLGKTQLTRQYEQLDWLYEEKYRRACNRSLTKTDPGGAEALAFQDRCKKRGVPLEALLHYCSVKAFRVVGQGSQYQRQQTTEFFLGLAGSLPPEGTTNLIDDVIAARADQYAVQRYNPKPSAMTLPSDQVAFATSQVADMKIGVPAVVTGTQDPLIYAQTFMQAMAQALGSVSQAGDQNAMLQQGQQMLGFLKLAGQASAVHLQRLSRDPLRQKQAKQLMDTFKRISGGVDQLAKSVQNAMMQRQKQAQQQMQKRMQAGQQALAVTQGQDPELITGLAGVERKFQVDTRKAQGQLELKAQKQNADLRLKQVKTAHDMRLEIADALASIMLDRAQAKAKSENQLTAK